MADENGLAVVKSSLNQSGDPMGDESYLQARDGTAVTIGKLQLLVSIVRKWDESIASLETCKHLAGREKEQMRAKICHLAQTSVNGL